MPTVLIALVCSECDRGIKLLLGTFAPVTKQKCVLKFAHQMIVYGYVFVRGGQFQKHTMKLIFAGFMQYNHFIAQKKKRSYFAI